MVKQLAAVLAAGMAVAGCSQDQGSTAPTTGVPGPSRATVADLPSDVRNSFRRDYPNAGITAITPGNAETGTPIYRVTFIDNGSPGSATYFMSGERLQTGQNLAVPAGRPIPPSGEPR